MVFFAKNRPPSKNRFAWRFDDASQHLSRALSSGLNFPTSRGHRVKVLNYEIP